MNRQIHINVNFYCILVGKKMLPRAFTDSHHKKRTSQNVAALGGGGGVLKVTKLHKKKEESTNVLNSQ